MFKMTDKEKQKMIEGMKLLKEACTGAYCCATLECPFWHECRGEEDDAPFQWQDSFLSDVY